MQSKPLAYHDDIKVEQKTAVAKGHMKAEPHVAQSAYASMEPLQGVLPVPTAPYWDLERLDGCLSFAQSNSMPSLSGKRTRCTRTIPEDIAASPEHLNHDQPEIIQVLKIHIPTLSGRNDFHHVSQGYMCHEVNGEAM